MKTSIDTSLGHPRLMIDGQAAVPVTFRSFRPQERYVAEFRALGVDIVNAQVSGNLCSLEVPYSLYGGVWQPDGYDDEPLHRQMADLAHWSDGARVLMMFDLNPPAWWLEANPGHPDPFIELAEAASSAVWRAEAAAYLRHVLSVCEESYGETIVGYALLGGRTHEWFCDRDVRDGELKVAAGEAATGRPWPSREARETAMGCGQFRDPVAQADEVAAWRFHHQQIADLVLHFAATAQEVLNHRKVVGSFFGYLLQFAGRRLLFSGHLDAGRVFASRDLDFYLGPANYSHRRADGVSSFMMPIDTLRGHGKLALLEFDHITPTAVTHVDGHPIPGQDSRLKSEDEAAGLMGRDACLALAKGQGMWWFDMFGGWFDHDRYRAVVAQVQRAAEALLDQPYQSIAEVAAVVDPESLYFLDGRGDLAQRLLCDQVDGLGRFGAPYDCVLLDDLADPAFNPARYKLILFLNAFVLDDRLRAAVARLQAGRTLAWVYAPGYIGAGGLDPGGLTELTGLSFTATESVQTVTLEPGASYGFRQPQRPGFVVEPPAGATIFGRTEGGEAGLVEAPHGGGRAVYSAVGPLPGWLLRQLAERAGAHLYTRDDDPLYASSQVLGLHAPRAGVRRVWLPRPVALRALLSSREGGVAGERLEPRQADGRWFVDVPFAAHEARLFAW